MGGSLPKVNLQRNLYNIKKKFMKTKGKKKKWKFWKKMMTFRGFQVFRDHINLI